MLEIAVCLEKAVTSIVLGLFFTEKLRDVFKNVDQLKEDLKTTTGMSTAGIDALLEASLPENSSQVSLLSS